MKNNQSILLAFLILTGSPLAIAAEPSQDAHATSAEAPAKKLAKKIKVRAANKSGDAAKPPAAPVATQHDGHVDHHDNTSTNLPVTANQNNGSQAAYEMHAIDAALINAHPVAVEPVSNVPEPAAVPAAVTAAEVQGNAVEVQGSAVEVQGSTVEIQSVKEEACSPPSKAEIATLFERWNASLQTGDAKKVVANYATPSILLPTVSNQARFTAAEKEDYFVHFLQRKPEGKIDERMIEVDCHTATDAGLYSFRFGDGSVVKARYSFAYKKVGDEWLISSHHSSAMPEKTDVAVHHEQHAAPASAPDRHDAPAKNGGWIRFP